MQAFLLMIVASILGCYSVAALDCKMCLQYEGSSSNKDVNKALEAMKSLGNSNCRDNPGDSSIGSMPCPSQGSGTKSVCSTASISATYEIPGTDHTVSIGMYMRGCHGVPQNDPDSSCDPISKYEDEIRANMGAQSNYYKRMGGTLCYCDSQLCNTKRAEAVQFSSGSDITTPAVLFSALLMCVAHMLF